MRAALIKKNGCLSLTAKALGCARSTVIGYLARHRELRAEAEQAREGVIDRVEFKLYEKAIAGDRACMFFLLKTQAKDRGYVERAAPPAPQHDLSRLTNDELMTLGPILLKLQTPAAGPPPPPPPAQVRSPEWSPE